jgi:uncharacterized protein with von Willebrand factor type A (vWA) domain
MILLWRAGLFLARLAVFRGHHHQVAEILDPIAHVLALPTEELRASGISVGDSTMRAAIEIVCALIFATSSPLSGANRLSEAGRCVNVALFAEYFRFPAAPCFPVHRNSFNRGMPVSKWLASSQVL